MHLNLYAAVAGASFDFAAFELESEGETPERRSSVRTYVDGMAREGLVLTEYVPADLADDLRTVVLAAAQAKRKLADGKPAAKAIDSLYTDEVSEAREKTTAYRGPC